MFSIRNNSLCRVLFAHMQDIAVKGSLTAVAYENCNSAERYVLAAMQSAYQNALSTDFAQCGKTAQDHFWCCAWASIECTSEYQGKLDVRNWFAAHTPKVHLCGCPECKSASDGVTGD